MRRCAVLRRGCRADLTQQPHTVHPPTHELRVPFQLAITLRNVATRALTAADFQDARGKDWAMQFRLVIGVQALA